MHPARITLVLLLGAAPLIAAEESRTDKTLVAWVAPANLTQQGGSVLTIQSGDRFDAIVFGERAVGRWMAGSNFFQRTPADQSGYPAETANEQTLVQIAIVYDGGHIRIYRDGEPYAAYTAKNIDLLGVDNHIALFGLRHIGAGSGTPFEGAIEDARIYGRALSPSEIASLEPNRKSPLEPFAWWDFEGDRVVDRAGRFERSAMTPGVELADGRLVLDGKGYLVAARSEEDARRAVRPESPRAPLPPYVPETPAWPVAPPDEWLTFHLAHPGPGDAHPGDPNCAFDYKGRYHLHYIYRNHTGFVFAHLSSGDLVRWTWHPTVLAPPTTGHGMFSGTGFYTKDGQPAIIYHGQGSGRNWIQLALDDRLNSWSDPRPVLPKTADGNTPEMRHWDPDCWRNGDTFYALSGGQNPQLMRSTDLESWRYLGDLLHEDYPPDLGVPKEEDISCANMFRIGNRWMLLCISHRLGCRYYLGDFQDEKYLPWFHAMMSWNGNHFFAPESMRTRDGRRVMWAWLLGLPIAPTGVQSLPRELELPPDGVLRIRPLRELRKLRYEPRSWSGISVEGGSERPLSDIEGDALELEVVLTAPLPEEVGLRLLGDDEGKDGMSIVAGGRRGKLTVGTTNPPFALEEGEDLTLRIFIDKNLVEVFANDRQAAAYAHQHRREHPNVRLFAEGSDAKFTSVKAWKMDTIYSGSAIGEVVFRDDFNEKLGDGWRWIRETSDTWRIREGSLQIRAEPGHAGTVKNALVREAPARSEAPYAIEVTVTNRTVPTVQYEQAGITWYRDGKPIFKLVKELVDGQLMIIPGRKKMEAETVQLRLIVTADGYTAQYRPDARGPYRTAATGKLPPPSGDEVSIQCYHGPPDVDHWMLFEDFRILKLPMSAHQ